MREEGRKRNKAKVSWKTNFKRKNVHEQRASQETWSSNYALALKHNFKELKNFVDTLWMAQRESKLGQCTRNKLTKKPFLLLNHYIIIIMYYFFFIQIILVTFE